MAISQAAMRKWLSVHKWSSLVCMLFMLMLCITGMPLIFHQEIDALTRAPDLKAEVTGGAQSAKLETVVRLAQAERPDWSFMFLTWDADKPLLRAVLGPTMAAGEGEAHIVPFDARSGERLSAPPANEGVMYFLLDLHASLLLGLPGTLFLGLMGLVFVLSVVSGVVVYAPFMRRLPFGAVRKYHRNRRIRWLDTHNMVGIVTLAWVTVVGVTGIILTMVTPLSAIWQHSELAAIAARHQHLEPPARPVSADVVRQAVLTEVPDADIYFISWPGSPYATPYHYAVALRGNTPLTEYLLRVALVDATTGEITDVKPTPWYLTMVNLSVPLHFGDYGGLPLKVIWALLNLATIVVLLTGIYLWLVRGQRAAAPVPAMAVLAEGRQ